MEVEFSVPAQRSSEEEDALQRSVKKFKENKDARSFLQPRKLVSYKDSLVGDIPGAYEQTFTRSQPYWDEDYESETEMEPLTEGVAEIKLSKETKARIRAPWSRALIVKVFGRSVGYHYLTFKINALWKPTAKMDCVTLGKGFFLVRFSNSEDYDNVLRGGPWFIGDYFLAIKPWEPYFIASEAKLTSVAAWVRLPELPIEFYDTSVLCEIGSAIGPVLRIDSYTASETREGYARLCVHLDLEKPLIRAVRVGRLVQKVLYEGISSLCFCCGKLGHKQENCVLKVKEPTREDLVGASLHSNEANEISGEAQPDSNYRPWMVVTRKKKNLGRMGKASGPAKAFTPTQTEIKGNSGLPQSSVHVEASEDLTKSTQRDSVDSFCETVSGVAAQNMQGNLEIRKDCVMEECFGNASSESQQDPRHISGTKRKAIVKNKGKGSEGLGIRNSKNSKSHKKVPSTTEGKAGLRFLSRELQSEKQGKNGEFLDGAKSVAKNRLGDLVQEPSGGNPRGVHNSDSSGANGNTGMVRGRAEAGVEKYLPNNTREYQAGGSSCGAQGMESHTQPVVEFSNGRAGDLVGSIRGVEQAEEAIRDAPLGRIRLDYSREDAGGFQRKATAHLGNHPTLKLLQIMAPV